ncbi:hypothetical protein [Caudoviricetes sp.]|nr:hypothetical protein [Caudoviricetes sp.]UOF81095.1 hypothetical protein [Caudoviricetes sp.]UOF82224.1 hypothetical protein [Caudoviricetes sp.]UOF82440.1 hypothetical protein [Caudoviricetes sp.]UOF82639.1 hypothetical protein [Caudoviricetes sp.]
MDVQVPRTARITASMLPDTNAYVDGDLVGDLITFANAPKSGIIETLTLVDQAKQDAALDVIFFSANPSSTTFTDNAALDIADADLLKVLGVIRIAATDYCDIADNAIATLRGLGLAYVAEGGNLYACLLSNGATPTYAATGDLLLALSIIPDA